VIESETKFLWKLLGKFLLVPFTFFQVLAGKKKKRDLLEPWFYLGRSLYASKVIFWIVIANIFIFFTSFFFSESLLNALVSRPSDLLEFKWYTLVTSGFLHADFSHLFFNMLGILVFGRIVEKKVRGAKTALIYGGALLISGIFTSLIHLFIIVDNTPGLGASGALMGLIASAILFNPLYMTYFPFPAPVMFVGWFTIYLDIVGVLNPSEDGIGHFAHIGGFLSIALLTFLFSREEKKTLQKGLFINIGSFILFSLLVFLL